jgi:transposase-like protein
MTKHSPFRYFKTSPEVIRLAVMMYVRFPLSLGNVEDLFLGWFGLFRDRLKEWLEQTQQPSLSKPSAIR